MSRRDHLDRCVTCRMQVTLCICEVTPRLATRTRLALLVHHREVTKPTNTGQLAARCLERSVVAVVGARDRPTVCPPVEPHEQAVLLYPAEDALPIARFATADRPVVLFVPDGSWRQAYKMRRRIAGLAAVPCVVLPDQAPTSYRLRHETHEDGLATLEAIAGALRILEGDAGPAIAKALLDVLRIMVDRTLWLRGQLGDDEVAGGLPAAARDQNPRGGAPRGPGRPHRST